MEYTKSGHFTLRRFLGNYTAVIAAPLSITSSAMVIIKQFEDPSCSTEIFRGLGNTSEGQGVMIWPCIEWGAVEEMPPWTLQHVPHASSALCALSISISPDSCGWAVSLQDLEGTFWVESSSLLLSVAGHSPAHITLGLRSSKSSRSFGGVSFVFRFRLPFLVKYSGFWSNELICFFPRSPLLTLFWLLWWRKWFKRWISVLCWTH